MNAKQFWRLIAGMAIVVVVAYAVWVLRDQSRTGGAAASGRLVFPDLPVNDIEAIALITGVGRLDLAKTDAGWTVPQRGGYPADFGNVAEFLRTLGNLKATQLIQASDAQLGQLGLGAPEAPAGAGTEVRLLLKGGKVAAVLRLGDKSQGEPRGGGNEMFGLAGENGRFLYVPATQQAMRVSQTFSTVTDTPIDWLDKEFVKIGELKSMSLGEGTPAPWKLTREKAGDEWQLADLPAGEKTDAEKARAAANALSWPRFADVAGRADKLQDTGLDKPRIVRLSDFDGVQCEFRVGKPDAEQRHFVTASLTYQAPPTTDKAEAKPDAKTAAVPAPGAKKADEVAALQKKLDGWVFLMDKATLDNVLKEKKEFVAPPPPPPEKPAAGKAGAVPGPAVPATLSMDPAAMPAPAGPPPAGK